ncbi:MAG: LacI family DNA-binding transcriptional regulator [bacterium]|nr:LacI family DNA-binding transcriptional regulator [bacterium]
MVSIYDIAKAAGVSATTVSRVLHNRSASTKTRIKVQQVIDKMGYIPDARASNLKSRQSNSIGVIVPDIANPIYPIAIKAMYELSRERGYHLILGNTYSRADEELEVLRMMARERVAGMIMGVCEGEDESYCNPYLEELINSGTSVVFAGRKCNGFAVDEITVDNEKGAYKATSYLLRIGRKRITFMAGKEGLYATEGRLRGYRQALSEIGIEPDKDLLSFGAWNRIGGQTQMREIIESKKLPDAVFCGNDLLAIGAMEVIEEAGLKVPDDIAVVGFDDIEIASLVRPRLTTVVQPHAKIGSLACGLLLDRIEERETGESKEIMIEPELIIRESA